MRAFPPLTRCLHAQRTERYNAHARLFAYYAMRVHEVRERYVCLRPSPSCHGVQMSLYCACVRLSKTRTFACKSCVLQRPRPFLCMRLSDCALALASRACSSAPHASPSRATDQAERRPHPSLCMLRYANARSAGTLCASSLFSLDVPPGA
eukprot:5785083-Pleurochrysis_carterae.AAC.1